MNSKVLASPELTIPAIFITYCWAYWSKGFVIEINGDRTVGLASLFRKLSAVGSEITTGLSDLSYPRQRNRATDSLMSHLIDLSGVTICNARSSWVSLSGRISDRGPCPETH